MYPESLASVCVIMIIYDSEVSSLDEVSSFTRPLSRSSTAVELELALDFSVSAPFASSLSFSSSPRIRSSCPIKSKLTTTANAQRDAFTMKSVRNPPEYPFVRINVASAGEIPNEAKVDDVGEPRIDGSSVIVVMADEESDKADIISCRELLLCRFNVRAWDVAEYQECLHYGRS